MAVPEVLDAAKEARDAGATRFCMGAAWREVKDGPQFEQVLEMVRGVKALGLEACCTLGMLTESQAQRLKAAGLDAYNHNLDSSREYYADIITTRTYDDRLRTLAHVRAAGITVCSGGIIGMGESVEDRCGMLVTLANQERAPGVGAGERAGAPSRARRWRRRPPVEPLELVRMIAVRAHPDAGVDGAAVGGAEGAVAARRSCSACWPARTASSSATACSPPGTRRTRRTRRCFADAGVKALEPRAQAPARQ